MIQCGLTMGWTDLEDLKASKFGDGDDASPEIRILDAGHQSQSQTGQLPQESLLESLETAEPVKLRTIQRIISHVLAHVRENKDLYFEGLHLVGGKYRDNGLDVENLPAALIAATGNILPYSQEFPLPMWPGITSFVYPQNNFLAGWTDQNWHLGHLNLPRTRDKVVLATFLDRFDLNEEGRLVVPYSWIPPEYARRKETRKYLTYLNPDFNFLALLKLVHIHRRVEIQLGTEVDLLTDVEALNLIIESFDLNLSNIPYSLSEMISRANDLLILPELCNPLVRWLVQRPGGRKMLNNLSERNPLILRDAEIRMVEIPKDTRVSLYCVESTRPGTRARVYPGFRGYTDGKGSGKYPEPEARALYTGSFRPRKYSEEYEFILTATGEIKTIPHNRLGLKVVILE